VECHLADEMIDKLMLLRSLLKSGNDFTDWNGCFGELAWFM